MTWRRGGTTTSTATFVEFEALGAKAEMGLQSLATVSSSAAYPNVRPKVANAIQAEKSRIQ
jgi:hypothetical protein